ncbi:MAG: hypothetical protein IKQ72_11465 [Bacteroidaceae bacterium]|nr:hypothetical protein [Bacteroidaceae bacterium]
MKRTLLLLMTALLYVNMYSQENPERGFIITNTNDTVYGTIDFRTNEINAEQCTFKADGSEEYVTYYPMGIVGYRFTDNGKFYVSKTFEYEGKEYKVFAEYMVKGMLNVYRVTNISHYPIFFFENERGEITSYKGYNNIYETDEKAYVKNSQDLYAYLSKSSFEASDKVEAKPMDEKQLIKIARIYHEDVCKSNEDCIEYEYNTKSDDDKCTLYVGMGIDNFFRSKDCDAETLAMLEFGVDFDMKRVRKGMSVFVGFDIAQRKKDDSLFNVAFNLKGACQWKMPFDNNKVIYRLGVSSYMLSNFGAYGGIGCDLGNKNLGLVLCAEIYSPSMKMSTFTEDYDDKFGSNGHLNLSISIRF